ncbi:MAG: hypothetical protein KBA75_07280 [Alphaproteobacteria bacterium]|nr:hypothetical protein [Alphaproteobacteria bacterium]
MKQRLTTLAFLAVVLPARAGECPYTPPPIPPVPELTISREACTFLLLHEQFQSADYQPGVDTMGRSVVPADIPAEAQLKLPETITVEITPALAHWLPNQNAPYDTLEQSRINLGTVTVTGGLLTFNGEPLGPAKDDELFKLCAQKMDTNNKPAKE